MNKHLVLLWGRLKAPLLSLLKSTLTKKALAKILGSTIAGGVYGWIIGFLVSQGVEKVLEPALELLVRKGLLYSDKTHGKIVFKKLEKAKEDDAKDIYTDIIIDV